MGLRSDIQTELTLAMNDEFEDVVVSFNLVKTVIGIYNPATGSSPDVETLYPSRGIFDSFGAEEIDGKNIRSEDEKVIVNGADITVSPDVNDVIRFSNNQEYLVIKPNPVMGGGSIPIIFEMQVRKNA